MDLKFTVHGLEDTIRNLEELPKATQRNVLKRALRKAAVPIAEAAEARLPSPGRTGKGHLRRQGITISETPPKGSRADAGKMAFAAVMKAGGTRKQARQALLAAGGSDVNHFATIYVGASRDPAAMQQEFGNVNHSPQPFMRPAYDTEGETAMRLIQRELATEVEKAAARRARRLAKGTAKRAR